MRYEDKIFHDLLDSVEWDEYEIDGSIKGRHQDSLVFAATDGNRCMIVIHPETFTQICFSCQKADYALNIKSSSEESEIICLKIAAIINRLAERKVLKFSKSS